MRQVFSRLVVASGVLALACATAMEGGPLNGDIGEETAGSSSAGTIATSGATSAVAGAGASTSAGTVSATGGSKANAFGGTGPALGGAAGSSKGGSGGGGATAGASSGGKAGTASGGSATAGSASGGAGNGAAGSSATCSSVADWSSQKSYVTGDRVASTCSGVFAESCTAGQRHQFECNPMAGSAGLPWCQSREPGVGNGWGQAWVDKGQCQ